MGKVKKYSIIASFSIALLLVTYVMSGYLLKETIAAKITKTERVSDTYLIFTDKGVYSNRDDWRFIKFNSSNIYGKLSQKIGQNVTFDVTGFRVPFLSWYQNIIDVKE
jgi:hypothetical protein